MKLRESVMVTVLLAIFSTLVAALGVAIGYAYYWRNLGPHGLTAKNRGARAGYLFLSAVLYEPPEDFWDLPPDFIEVQRRCEAVAREAGFHIPEYDAKRENWRQAILNLKTVLDKYDIPFPAIPEVGISGEEVNDIDLEDIIPVF